jgi:hypothetical protein
MRNFLLTLGFAFCLFTISAQKINTFHNVVGYWNSTYERWDFDGGRDVKITFELTGKYLIANDGNNSKYLLVEVTEETDDFFSVEAIDERGHYCTIMIANNTNGVDKLAIMYGGDGGLLYEYWFFF